MVKVEWDVVGDAEIFDEVLVGVGFGSAEAVVDVDGAEADAEGFAGGGVGGVEGEEEGDGVCTAGDGGAEAVAGLDLDAVEGESRGGHPTYVSWWKESCPAGRAHCTCHPTNEDLFVGTPVRVGVRTPF